MSATNAMDVGSGTAVTVAPLNETPLLIIGTTVPSAINWSPKLKTSRYCYQTVQQ